MSRIDELLGSDFGEKVRSAETEKKPTQRATTPKQDISTLKNFVSTYIEPKLQDIFDPTSRFLQGLGRGVTLGLTDVPAAQAIRLVRAYTGGAPLSFQEAYSTVKRSAEEAKQAGPAYSLGQLAGNIGAATLATPLVPMGAVSLYSGSRLLPAITTGGITGAISGATEAEYPTEIVPGAVVGGATGAGLGALAGGLGALQKGYAKQWVENVVESRMPDLIDSEIKKFTAKNFRMPNESEIKQITETIRKKIVRGTEYKEAIKQGTNRALTELLSGLGPAAVGGAAGAGAALYYGQDPLLGATIGGGGALTLAKLRALNELSLRGGDIAARIASKGDVVLPGIYQTTARAAQPYITERLSNMLEEQRMDELAERFIRQRGQ